MSVNDQSAITNRVVEWLQDSIVTIDLEGVITSWNRAAEVLYGYRADEVIGRPLSMLTLAADVAQLFVNIEKVRKGGIVQLYDTIRIHKDGKELHLEIRLSPLKDTSGKVIGLVTLARDISEVRKVQNNLTKSEARLKTLSDVIPQLVWENDDSGKAIYFNRRWFEYSGSSWSESVGPGWQVLAHPRDGYALRRWAEALLNRQVFESEVRLRRHDGVYRWHLLRNVPYNDVNGEFVGWFGSATDIHDLHEAQASAEEHMQKLRAVLEAAVDFAIIILDDNGFISDWNSGAEVMFGYKREEVIGENTAIIFTPEDRHGGIHMVELHNAKSTGRSLDERWHLRKDGTRFFMSGVMVPILHASIPGFVKIARNITDRKLMEEALFLSEQRKNVVQSAEIGEWDWHINTNTTHVSEQTCFIFGISPCKTIMGSPLREYIHPDDLPQLQQSVETALNGLNILHAEFRIIRADNKSIRWVSAYGRVVAHENSSPTRMIGVIYDITTRKLLESQKDDFISVASHELKTPVTAIKAYAGILMDELAGSDHSESAEILRKLNGQIDRLVKLIHNLLDANSMETEVKLRPQVFDLNVLVAELVNELRLSAPTHQLLWDPGNISLVHADRDRIGQVISNFITNAVKYSKGKERVVITTTDGMDGAIFKVQDFGIGLAPKEQGRVFERYYRSKNPTVENTPGLGLGLYIAAEIIRQHSGAIWVESIQGQGATFCFKLPYS